MVLLIKQSTQRLRLGDVAAFENRQPVTAAKFINKVYWLFYCPALFVGVELKPISDKKLRIYLSPRHIAKSVLAVRSFLYVIFILQNVTWLAV